MLPDPAVEIAEDGRGFVPADDKHVDLLAVRELVSRIPRWSWNSLCPLPQIASGCRTSNNQRHPQAESKSSACGGRAPILISRLDRDRKDVASEPP
jgi:hypothetical protein